MQETTTIRVSKRTINILKKIKEKKKIPINAIVSILAENELKREYKIENIIYDKQNK